MSAPVKWLLLLYGLPTKSGAERVRLWRQLKKLGALSLKTSAYLLPDKPENAERFQWLAQRVRDEGGEADRKSTRLNSSHLVISYAVFCLKKKNKCEII